MLDVPKGFRMVGSHILCGYWPHAPLVHTAPSLSGVQQAGAIPDRGFIINPERLMLPLDLLHGLNRHQLISSPSKPLRQEPALSQVTAARVLLQLLLKAHPGLSPPSGPDVPRAVPGRTAGRVPPLPC